MAMENTAESLGIPPHEIRDMSLLLSSETPEEWHGVCRTHWHKEKAEPTERKEKLVSPCPEMSIVKKYEKHIIEVNSPEISTPKTQDFKTKALRMFVESQIDEGTNCQEQRAWIGKGILERNIQVTNKDMTRVDLTVRIEINLMTELAMKMTTQDSGSECTWEQLEEPAKKGRTASIERAFYGKKERTKVTE